MKNPAFIDDSIKGCMACNKIHNNGLWHYRLGHLPIYKMKTLSLVSKDCNDSSFETSTICHQARQHNLSFTNSDSHSHKPFDRLHADVWGPYKVDTYNGFKYFLTLVDDYSRCTWVHLTKRICFYYCSSIYQICSESF